MELYRSIIEDLKDWKSRPDRKPLILKGPDKLEKHGYHETNIDPIIFIHLKKNSYQFITDNCFSFQRKARVMNLSPYVALIQLFINMSMP